MGCLLIARAGNRESRGGKPSQVLRSLLQKQVGGWDGGGKPGSVYFTFYHGSHCHPCQQMVRMTMTCWSGQLKIMVDQEGHIVLR